MRADDDVLLDLLADALRPAVPPEPTFRELVALEQAVRLPPRPAPRRTPVRQKALVALVGMGMVATSGTAFALEQTGLPRPVRAAAHAVGLPVDSPGLHDAHEAESRLRRALRQRDDGRVRAAADDLRQLLAELPAADRHAVAEPLLADARARLERDGVEAPGAGTATGASGQPAGTTSTTGRTGTTGTTGKSHDGDTSGPSGGSPASTTTSAPARSGDATTTAPTTAKPNPDDPKVKDPKSKDPKHDPTAPSTSIPASASPSSSTSTSTSTSVPRSTTTSGSVPTPQSADGGDQGGGAGAGDHQDRAHQNPGTGTVVPRVLRDHR